MGVEYYLVSDEHKERYGLGRGFWREYGAAPSIADLKETAREVAENYDASPSEARRFANEVAKWATERGGKVRVVSDADEGYDDVDEYDLTGDVTKRSDLSSEQIRQLVELRANALRDELGADHVEISVRVETTPPIDDPDERCFVDYFATSGYESQLSGFGVVRKPNV